MRYQNILLFNQNKFLSNKIYLCDIKIYFYLIETNLYSKKYFYYLTFFHPIEMLFII